MAQLVQVQDDTGAKKNVGATTAAGKGALRVVSPDTDSGLANVKTATDNARTSLGEKLDALLAELQKQLTAGTFATDTLDRLRTVVENHPSDYPDATAHALLADIRTLLDQGPAEQVFATNTDFPDAQAHTLLQAIRDAVQALPTDGLTDGELRAADVEVNDDAAQALLTEVVDRLGDIATPADGSVNKRLGQIVFELQQKLEAGQEVALDAATIASLLPQTDALTDGELRASDVAVTLDGEVVTNQDRFTDGEVLTDQTGTEGVLTFTFSSPVDLVWVLSSGGDSRSDPFGGDPSATAGIPCVDGNQQPLTVTTSSVKVYAPQGAVVHVWGYRY